MGFDDEYIDFDNLDEFDFDGSNDFNFGPQSGSDEQQDNLADVTEVRVPTFNTSDKEESVDVLSFFKGLEIPLIPGIIVAVILKIVLGG